MPELLAVQKRPGGQAGTGFSDAGACPPRYTKLDNRVDAGLAASQDRGQYRSYECLPGSARPNVRKRYTTPRSDFRFALQPVTVARPCWICTSFHGS